MPAEFLRSGKVRDLYALDDDRLLLVASDRLSAFDVVLPTPIPDKGRVLTGLSRWWFDGSADRWANHVLDIDPRAVAPELATTTPDLVDRAIVCRRTRPLPAELVVRGYLAGSGWVDYQRDGHISGVALPAGLREGDRLPEPILTPTTKAEQGHDQPIDFDALVALVGADVAEQARETALAVYEWGATVAERAGLILADTKLEMGLLAAPGADPDAPAELLLIDELLTPDSSRFWEAAEWRPGGAQASFDKQYVRDWLLASGWDRTPPGPELPPDVVEGTRARYIEAFERLTGASFTSAIPAPGPVVGAPA